MKTKKLFYFLQGGEQGFGKDKIINILKILINNFSNFQVIAIAGKNMKIKNCKKFWSRKLCKSFSIYK